MTDEDYQEMDYYHQLREEAEKLTTAPHDRATCAQCKARAEWEQYKIDAPDDEWERGPCIPE